MYFQLELASAHSPSHDLIMALVHGTIQYQLRRNAPAAHDWAEQLIALAVEQTYPSWREYGAILDGWALTVQGYGDQGLPLLRQGLDTWQRRNSPYRQPYFLALLADACGLVGQSSEGLLAVADALVILASTGERFYQAELHRLQGKLLLQQNVAHAAQAEACFHQALNIVRQQQVKSLELRAAASLVRLWQSQDKRQDAYDLLSPVYEWFTEGFDTADLKEAKALLVELSI